MFYFTHIQDFSKRKKPLTSLFLKLWGIVEEYFVIVQVLFCCSNVNRGSKSEDCLRKISNNKFHQRLKMKSQKTLRSNFSRVNQSTCSIETMKICPACVWEKRFVQKFIALFCASLVVKTSRRFSWFSFLLMRYKFLTVHISDFFFVVLIMWVVAHPWWRKKNGAFREIHA